MRILNLSGSYLGIHWYAILKNNISIPLYLIKSGEKKNTSLSKK